MKSILQKATFEAGCFWGVEAAFRKIKGVVSTSVGYMGGTMENPTYEDVCTDRTGHAEDLLEIFWMNHNPTTLNRQGPDRGTQYRSVIFYHTPEQEAAARASKERLQRSERYKKDIVTQIEPAGSNNFNKQFE